MDNKTYDAVDLFAGPGGWDVAARSLGLRTLGIEWDAAACETRRASGLPTLQGDVRTFLGEVVRRMSVRGLIGSPPCQTFSMAGGGAGRKALDTVLDLVRRMGERDVSLDYSVFSDERTGLVLEPLRWALFAIDHGKPFEWLAFEQVPTVLPVWEAMAEALRAEGYSVAVGKLSAEEYGVPQTRIRAFLVARRNGEAALPASTHRKYRKGVPQHEGNPNLLPWVSMAEALGWAEPRVVVSNYGTGGDASKRGERTSAEPAATVTGKSKSNRVFIAGNQPNATVRAAEEPAPTVAFGHNAAGHRWTFERPATTIQGDARVGQPGHKCMTQDCHPGNGTTRQFDEGSLRITPEEAAALQSFPADHAWRGGRTKIHQQIGNAVPPDLARHVLAAAAGIKLPAPEPRPFA